VVDFGERVGKKSFSKRKVPKKGGGKKGAKSPASNWWRVVGKFFLKKHLTEKARGKSAKNYEGFEGGGGDGEKQIT